MIFAKGQLVSKELFCFFNPSKNRMKNICPSRLGQKLKFSFSLFGRIEDTKISFEINWALLTTTFKLGNLFWPQAVFRRSICCWTAPETYITLCSRSRNNSFLVLFFLYKPGKVRKPIIIGTVSWKADAES